MLTYERQTGDFYLCLYLIPGIGFINIRKAESRNNGQIELHNLCYGFR